MQFNNHNGEGTITSEIKLEVLMFSKLISSIQTLRLGNETNRKRLLKIMSSNLGEKHQRCSIDFLSSSWIYIIHCKYF